MLIKEMDEKSGWGFLGSKYYFSTDSAENKHI